MNRPFVILSLLLSLGPLSCAPKELRVKEYTLSSDIPDPAKPPPEFYVIGPGDALTVNLWKEPNLSGSVKVRPDGYVTLPLVNEIQVAGMTTGHLRKVLENRYQAFVNDPFVTIRVENIAASEIFVIGQVNKPGAYPVTGNDTLVQLLTRAGGLTIFADRDDIKVIRREGERVREYVVDYDAILKGDLKQDLIVRPGDRVIVP